MEPTYGDYDRDSVQGIDKLRERLDIADTVEDLSHILSDFLAWGNNKVHKSVAIFNMNSATDCPNADTDADNPSETGACQVPWKDCYAHKSEEQYPQPLDYRRKQESLWDSLSAEEWAGAFKCLLGRKRNDVTAIRVSQAGDFRHNDDIRKWERIATMLATDGIIVYTYSASHKLDWSIAHNLVVNASNSLAEYGDRRFFALSEGAPLPDGAVWCPFDHYDGDLEDRPQCGECMLCLRKEGPDVAIPIE